MRAASAPRRSAARWALGACGGVLLFALLLAVCVEVALQIASRFVSDRAGAWRPGAAVRILCVGDSHTFGTGVPEDQSHPAWLQRHLDERAPGRYSVINLGLPGMNTAQVYARLPVQIARYRPSLVVVWAGVNDEWNRAGLEYSGGWMERVDAFATRSRLYRLIRVHLHDRAMERVAVATRADGRHQVAESESCTGEDCEAEMTWRIQHGGVVDVVQRPSPRRREREEQRRLSYGNYRAIHDLLRDAGIPLALISYPVDLGSARVANWVLNRISGELDIPLVDSHAAVARLPTEERKLLWALHPNAAMYREIASDLVPIVERLSEARNSGARPAGS
jgi:lysophospholipase L1-like esterase